MKKTFILTSFLILLFLNGCAKNPNNLEKNTQSIKKQNSSNIENLEKINYPIDGELHHSFSKKLIVFTRDLGVHKESEDFADSVDNYNQLILKNVDTKKEEVLVNSNKLINLNISDSSKNDFPLDKIININNPIFSLDNNSVYFMASGWVISPAIFSVDIKSKKIQFIVDGISLDIITEGQHKGNLLINKRTWDEINFTRYCNFIIDSNNGKVLLDLKKCL